MVARGRRNVSSSRESGLGFASHAVTIMKTARKGALNGNPLEEIRKEV